MIKLPLMLVSRMENLILFLCERFGQGKELEKKMLPEERGC
jgi:hypothetical protein